MVSAWRPPEVRAIFFDAVGTLIVPDPPAAAVYAAVGRRFGSRLGEGEIAARFRAAFCREEEQDQAEGMRTDEAREEARWRTIVAEVLADVADPEACFQALFTHFARPEAWRCYPEVARVLAALAERGYRLGLASNFDERLRPIAAALSPLRPLHYLVISSTVGWRKPATAFFQRVCREVSLPPEAILLVGDDRVNDYEGARQAGMRAVLLDPRQREPVAGADRIAALTELLALPSITG